MALHRIIYTSHSNQIMTPGALVELLRRSREKNTRLGVTGLLLHADGSFMQTIEGEDGTLHGLYAAIAQDPRHSGAIIMCDDPIAQRSFNDWSMAFREITRKEAADIPGFNHLTGATHNSPHERDIARQIMQRFAAANDLTSI
jgi:Sensors of blue-light using FAD